MLRADGLHAYVFTCLHACMRTCLHALAYMLACVDAYTLACVHACTLICPFMSILALKVKQGVLWHRRQEIDPDLHFVHPGGLTLGAVTRTLKSKQHCARKCDINVFQRADAAKKKF